MPSVTFGVTSKRINSTSTVMTNSVSRSCKLKEPCSMQSPTFLVQGLSKSTNYNYCSWGGRYYWIDDIVYTTNDIQEVSGHIDPLATYKSDILDTTAYVLLGDSAHKTPFKDDIRFGPDHKKARPSGSTGTGSFNMGFDRTTWTVVMTVQAAVNDVYSSVLTYAMSVPTFLSLLKNFSATVKQDVDTWRQNENTVLNVLSNGMVRLMTGGASAMENIRTVFMIPIPLSTFISNSEQTITDVKIGPYAVLTSNPVYVMDPSKTLESNGIIYLNRPIAATAYPWLNSPKYCSIQLTHPCGFQELNCPAVLEETMIYCWWSVSLCSGEYTIRVTSESDKDSDTITIIKGSTGIDIMNIVPADGNNITERMETAATNMITNLIPGGGAFFHIDQGRMSPSGNGSNIASGWTAMHLLTPGKEIFYDVEYYVPSIFEGGVEEYNAYCNEFGYMVGRYMRIGDNTGFVCCENASVSDIPGATEASKKTINQYLNSGIYIEA